MKSQQDIFNFMNARNLCVISTVGSEGNPQSAVVGFGLTEDLKLVFRTAVSSRKATNIQAKGTVSVVIGWDTGTVQYEGVARQLEGEEANKFAEIHAAKDPSGRRALEFERYFVVEPKWIKFTEITSTPWDITELSF